jgi:hypothetical protein
MWVLDGTLWPSGNRKPETVKIRFFFGHKVQSYCGKCRAPQIFNFFFPEDFSRPPESPKWTPEFDDRFRWGLRNLENNEKLYHCVNKFLNFLFAALARIVTRHQSSDCDCGGSGHMSLAGL